MKRKNADIILSADELLFQQKSNFLTLLTDAAGTEEFLLHHDKKYRVERDWNYRGITGPGIYFHGNASGGHFKAFQNGQDWDSYNTGQQVKSTNNFCQVHAAKNFLRIPVEAGGVTGGELGALKFLKKNAAKLLPPFKKAAVTPKFFPKSGKSQILFTEYKYDKKTTVKELEEDIQALIEFPQLKTMIQKEDSYEFH